MLYAFIDRQGNNVTFHAYDITLNDIARIGDAVESLILEERNRAVFYGDSFKAGIEKREVDGSRIIRNIAYKEENHEYE